MLAAFATLVFLVTLGLAAVVLAEILVQSGVKIAAALKGHSPLATAPRIPPVALRVSQRSRPQRVLRAQPRLQTGLRAAA